MRRRGPSRYMFLPSYIGVKCSRERSREARAIDPRPARPDIGRRVWHGQSLIGEPCSSCWRTGEPTCLRADGRAAGMDDHSRTYPLLNATSKAVVDWSKRGIAPRGTASRCDRAACDCTDTLARARSATSYPPTRSASHVCVRAEVYGRAHIVNARPAVVVRHASAAARASVSRQRRGFTRATSPTSDDKIIAAAEAEESTIGITERSSDSILKTWARWACIPRPSPRRDGGTTQWWR